MRSVALFLGILALTAAMIVARPASVSAHAELDHSEPAADATLTTAPSVVKLSFTEELQLKGSSLMVKNAAGQQVDSKDVKLDPADKEHKTLLVSLPANLPAGTYKVMWKSVSADDGDEDEDDFSFTVRAAAAAPPAVASPAAAASPAAVVVPAAPAAAAPAPRPAAQPSPSPAAAQIPQALPRAGSAEPSDPLLWFALGGVLLLGGMLMLRRARVL